MSKAPEKDLDRFHVKDAADTTLSDRHSEIVHLQRAIAFLLADRAMAEEEGIVVSEDRYLYWLHSFANDLTNELDAIDQEFWGRLKAQEEAAGGKK